MLPLKRAFLCNRAAAAMKPSRVKDRSPFGRARQWSMIPATSEGALAVRSDLKNAPAIRRTASRRATESPSSQFTSCYRTPQPPESHSRVPQLRVTTQQRCYAMLCRPPATTHPIINPVTALKLFSQPTPCHSPQTEPRRSILRTVAYLSGTHCANPVL